MNSTPDPNALAALLTEVRELGTLVARLPDPSVAPPAITEDLVVIGTQARNAVDALSRLQALAPLGFSAELDVLLHRMNNFFTGIASLATLCRDDVLGAPVLSASLVEVEQKARRAADRVRELARGQRQLA